VEIESAEKDEAAAPLASSPESCHLLWAATNFDATDKLICHAKHSPF
jgi:hypothetical protein